MSENTESAAFSQNSLSSDVEIKGTISFSKELRFDGKLEGEIVSSGALSLGDNAEITGEIITHSVVVRGKVKGNVTVADRCELRGEANLQGDLKAARLVMEENVTLIGKAEVTPAGGAGVPKDPGASNSGGVIRPFNFVKQALGGN